MTRASKSILATVLVVVGVGFALAVASNAKPHRVTREKFDEIQVGMTVEDVERILGVARDVLDYPIHEYDFPPEIGVNNESHAFQDAHAIIMISADADNIIYAKRFGTRRRVWLERILHIFGG